MEPKTSYIELKLISCKDLRAFNFFQKLTVYALVSIETNDLSKVQLSDEHKQQQRTPTHRDPETDGSNPEWNQHTRFDLKFLSQHSDPTDFFIKFEFRHDGVILGDKLLGECRVALHDLIRDVPGAERFVSYEVRSVEGKPNGIFNFSYKLNGIGTHSSEILQGGISGYPVLAPEDCTPVQFPPLGIENQCCYPPIPPVCCVQEGSHYSPVAAAIPQSPSSVSSPSYGGYHSYYPPPPPMPYHYPPPPPPHVAQVYPPIGPGPNHWQSGPNFEHRW